MSSILTQCPECQTSFRVTSTQLEAAAGQVRCGSCLCIFSALSNRIVIRQPDFGEHETEQNAADDIDTQGVDIEDLDGSAFDTSATAAQPPAAVTADKQTLGGINFTTTLTYQNPSLPNNTKVADDTLGWPQDSYDIPLGDLNLDDSGDDNLHDLEGAYVDFSEDDEDEEEDEFEEEDFVDEEEYEDEDELHEDDLEEDELDEADDDEYFAEEPEANFANITSLRRADFPHNPDFSALEGDDDEDEEDTHAVKSPTFAIFEEYTNDNVDETAEQDDDEAGLGGSEEDEDEQFDENTALAAIDEDETENATDAFHPQNFEEDEDEDDQPESLLAADDDFDHEELDDDEPDDEDDAALNAYPENSRSAASGISSESQRHARSSAITGEKAELQRYLSALEDEEGLEALNPDDLEFITDEPVTISASTTARRFFVFAALLVLNLLLTAVLAWQFLNANLETLNRSARYARYMPLVCRVMQCPLPEPVSNVSLLYTQQLLVRSHPRIRNALEVSFIFRNDAPVDQPFPTIELDFSDSSNRLLANRLFQPADYLPPELQQMPVMPALSSLQITLELADPGSDAVNYAIAFH